MFYTFISCFPLSTNSVSLICFKSFAVSHCLWNLLFTANKSQKTNKQQLKTNWTTDVTLIKKIGHKLYNLVFLCYSGLTHCLFTWYGCGQNVTMKHSLLALKGSCCTNTIYFAPFTLSTSLILFILMHISSNVLRVVFTDYTVLWFK